jgi:hypothetical protein
MMKISEGFCKEAPVTNLKLHLQNFLKTGRKRGKEEKVY